MKISKSTQRRIVALFVIVCLMFLPDLILSVVRVVFDEDWRTTENITYVGTVDVNRPSYMLADGEQSFNTSTIVRSATADEPAIVVEPSQYIVYATDGDYEVDTTAAKIRTVLRYILMIATVSLIGLVLAIVYQAICGFRTGNFFHTCICYHAPRDGCGLLHSQFDNVESRSFGGKRCKRIVWHTTT